MRAFFAAPSSLKQDEIAARQIQALHRSCGEDKEDKVAA